MSQKTVNLVTFFVGVQPHIYRTQLKKRKNCHHFLLTYSRLLFEFPVSHCAHNLSFWSGNPSFTSSEASPAYVSFQNLWKPDLNIWASTYGQCYTFFVIISLSLSLSHTHTHTYTSRRFELLIVRYCGQRICCIHRSAVCYSVALSAVRPIQLIQSPPQIFESPPTHHHLPNSRIASRLTL
jgi:hypothetical protein